MRHKERLRVSVYAIAGHPDTPDHIRLIATSALTELNEKLPPPKVEEVMGILYVQMIGVRDSKLKGTKFNRNDEQQCALCKQWKPFTRQYWPTSMYIVCRRCVYQLNSNVKPDKIKVYRPR